MKCRPGKCTGSRKQEAGRAGRAYFAATSMLRCCHIQKCPISAQCRLRFILATFGDVYVWDLASENRALGVGVFLTFFAFLKYSSVALSRILPACCFFFSTRSYFHFFIHFHYAACSTAVKRLS